MGNYPAPGHLEIALKRIGGTLSTAVQQEKRTCKFQSTPAAAASGELVLSNETFVTPQRCSKSSFGSRMRIQNPPCPPRILAGCMSTLGKSRNPAS